MAICAHELLFYEGQREISKSSLGRKMKANTEEKPCIYVYRTKLFGLVTQILILRANVYNFKYLIC